jgi:hypothetical protein
MLNLTILHCCKNSWNTHQTLPQDLHLIMSQLKKGAHVSPFAISSFFFSTSKFKKDDAIQVVVLEDLMLFVIRGLMPMKTVESIWF